MAQRDETAKLANALWSLKALEMEPAEFQAKFDSIYIASEGPATFWKLGGAANDYMRHHPDSINVPTDLAPRLLASQMVDARIIGLKLLVCCSSDLDLISDSICHALESEKQSEMYGGLYELGNLLRRYPPPTSIPASALLRQLHKLRSSGDSYVRESAERFIDMLNT